MRPAAAGRARRVTIFDYGAGNLHSLAKALAGAGPEIEVRIEPDPAAALDTDLLILPGVGAFTCGARQLEPGRDEMRRALEQGLPCLGVCLGMQLLFEGSDEGPGSGLGILAGRVTRLGSERLPHIGWNTVTEGTDPLLREVQLRDVYYAHSFACRPEATEVVTAWTEVDGDRFPAIVRWRNTVGVQFHPEKSSAAGVRFVRGVVGAALEARV